ncbi:MAG TPA: GDYXXLXY domain-containing protein [Chloroflexi bacterium]|nr:GDYXXLXY domain-containing protein [Chloroflexota bacterium]
MKIRIIILWLVAALALLVINVQAFQRERLAASGQVIFLELAPVDPRSLIQGDYMRLRYAVSGQVKKGAGARDGLIVLQLDENNIARYARIHDPQTPLAKNEILLRYRQQDSDARIGPESFFFQEGQAKYYNAARYGELRVSPAGDVMLVGLRGESLETLGPP